MTLNVIVPAVQPLHQQAMPVRDNRTFGDARLAHLTVADGIVAEHQL
jgi:hypothetical protein